MVYDVESSRETTRYIYTSLSRFAGSGPPWDPRSLFLDQKVFGDAFTAVTAHGRTIFIVLVTHKLFELTVLIKSGCPQGGETISVLNLHFWVGEAGRAEH
jgi:hypothetical protein